jgi:hypothetical protein
MTQTEYDALKRTIEDAYRRDLQALQRVWELSKSLPPILTSQTATPSITQAAPTTDYSDALDEDDSTSRIDVIGMVKEVVRAHLSGEFTSTDVADKIEKLHPELGATLKRSSITSAMNRLVVQELLELVEAGSGKRPSLYRKTLAF